MNSLSATARKAVELGLFAIRPSETAIARLVDFHVHHLSDDVNAGRGLDLVKMQSAFSPHWSLRWHKAYSYLGAFSELGAPQQWRDKASLLKAQFPEDGANFCAVWLLCPLPLLAIRNDLIELASNWNIRIAKPIMGAHAQRSFGLKYCNCLGVLLSSHFFILRMCGARLFEG